MAKYFELSASNGFAMRIHYDDSVQGFISIENIQIQSASYTGTWYPHGSIKINDETVLTMSNINPATHLFSVGTYGTNWYDMTAIGTGTALPVSNSTKITASKATIEITAQLYRDAQSAKPTFSGSETVELISGLVYIANGSSFDAYEVYIANGTEFERYEPYVADGSKFVLCN